MGAKTKPDLVDAELLEWMAGVAAGTIKVYHRGGGVNPITLLMAHGHAVPMHELVSAVRVALGTNTRRAGAWVRSLTEPDGPLLWLATDNSGLIHKRLFSTSAHGIGWGKEVFGPDLAHHMPGLSSVGKPRQLGDRAAYPHRDGWVVLCSTMRGWLETARQKHLEDTAKRELEQAAETASLRSRRGEALAYIEAFLAQLGNEHDELRLSTFQIHRTGQHFDRVCLELTNDSIDLLAAALQRAGLVLPPGADRG